jgi:hypothetical protein
LGKLIIFSSQALNKHRNFFDDKRGGVFCQKRRLDRAGSLLETRLFILYSTPLQRLSSDFGLSAPNRRVFSLDITWAFLYQARHTEIRTNSNGWQRASPVSPSEFHYAEVNAG